MGDFLKTSWLLLLSWGSASHGLPLESDGSHNTVGTCWDLSYLCHLCERASPAQGCSWTQLGSWDTGERTAGSRCLGEAQPHHLVILFRSPRQARAGGSLAAVTLLQFYQLEDVNARRKTSNAKLRTKVIPGWT